MSPALQAFLNHLGHQCSPLSPMLPPLIATNFHLMQVICYVSPTKRDAISTHIICKIQFSLTNVKCDSQIQESFLSTGLIVLDTYLRQVSVRTH